MWASLPPVDPAKCQIPKVLSTVGVTDLLSLHPPVPCISVSPLAPCHVFPRSRYFPVLKSPCWTLLPAVALIWTPLLLVTTQLSGEWSIQTIPFHSLPFALWLLRTWIPPSVLLWHDTRTSSWPVCPLLQSTGWSQHPFPLLITLKIHLFMWDRARMSRRKDRERGRKSQAASTWSTDPTQGSIPQPWDHYLSQNQESDAEWTKPPRIPCTIGHFRKNSFFSLIYVRPHWGILSPMSSGLKFQMEKWHCGWNEQVKKAEHSTQHIVSDHEIPALTTRAHFQISTCLLHVRSCAACGSLQLWVLPWALAASTGPVRIVIVLNAAHLTLSFCVCPANRLDFPIHLWFFFCSVSCTEWAFKSCWQLLQAPLHPCLPLLPA